MAQLEPRQHGRPTDVEVAVLEAQHLVDIVPLARLDLERRRPGARQQLDLGDAHLDLAGGQARIDRIGVASDHRAAGPDNVFRAQPLGQMVRRGRGPGVEDELHEAGAVAQVDEDEAAVIAAAGHPAGEPHLAPHIADPQLTGQRTAQLTGQRGVAHLSPPPLPPRGLPLPLP